MRIDKMKKRGKKSSPYSIYWLEYSDIQMKNKQMRCRWRFILDFTRSHY